MKQFKIIAILVLNLFLLSIIGCSSDGNTATEQENQETYLKATVNGEEYIGKIADFNTDDETYFYIESVSEDGKKILELNCNFAPSEGTFKFPENTNLMTFLYSDTAHDGVNTTRVYQTNIYQDNPDEGTLTISKYQTDMYNTSLKGTLSFTAPCFGSTCGEEGVVAIVNITNASFFVKLN